MKLISSLTRSALGACSAAAMLAGCGGPASSSGQPASQSGQPSLLPRLSAESRPLTAPASKIAHVVIIIQENRTIDDLFQFLPGANTQSYGLDSHGKTVPLKPEPLTAPYDLGHVHDNWVTEYNNGGMNGFDLEKKCTGGCPTVAYGYVPQSEVQPYYEMAETYAFGDEMFQTNQGPSFPAHQYLIRGTSAVSDGSNLYAADNVGTSAGGGCDSPVGSKVKEINVTSGEENASTYPCFTVTSLPTELESANVSWRYYQATTGAGVWNAVDAIYPLWSQGNEYDAHVIAPSSQVLTDISNNQLASVVWITPTSAASDHAKTTDGSGPSWVASIVNAIGKSQYWNDTAIFVTWDDWGGWYDHVKPPEYNKYELGFRVPLIVISPYAKRHYISHQQHEFGSILKFTETIFGLPSLQTTDGRSDDLSDCFDFNGPPMKFKHISVKYAPSYFFRQPSVKPDDD
ncbi:MAG: alkaline phosphatase family protein [Candidatus Cybelea sp.]|jgi:phospholipase C